MKRYTLEEIGKLAGVSRATVSRVINHYPHIRPEIRERVEAVIAQTGFQPNAVARSLVSSRTNIVGLIIPSTVQEVFTDPYYAYVINGISQSCNANGLILSLFLIHSLEEERNVIQAVVGTGLVDGLIITASRRNREMLATLLASQLPIVFIGQPDNDTNTHYVDVDNVSGGYLATEHLISLGYENIGIIVSYMNKSGEARLDGYKRALSDHGLPFSEDLVAYGDYSLESGYHAMKQLIKRKPQAVFATNDTMAFGAIRALKEAGLRVPEDIAIIGFDDLPSAQRSENPALSTIHQPIQQTGLDAVELLLKVVNGEVQKAQHQFIPTTLVVRESCGAARKTGAGSQKHGD